ncbi:uncharacterized protein LOC128280956 [Gossypium arboreum]|uniref:uncharacterized protein LOC128280956 n=1 Tax=Gossypium arboreum TaxID=29729 RepID=UPI0022F19123|nr:uncharacterized protein LOC128280956 [Gossypium arboreum]
MLPDWRASFRAVLRDENGAFLGGLSGPQLIALSPRSSNANLEGLAKISVEIVIDKANATLNFIVDLFKNVSDPVLYRSYGTCIDSYDASVERLLPEAIAALSSKDYATSRYDAATVAINVNACDKQFSEKTPFSDRNRLVHDLSLMSAGIIELLG